MFEPVAGHVAETLRNAAIAIATPLPFFLAIGLVAKRGRLLHDVRRALPETKTNLLIHFVDAMLIAPPLLALSIGLQRTFHAYDLVLVPSDFWNGLHPALVMFCAIFFGDFIGYWRHRLEHTPALWPSHAVHHSDTEMTWLAIFRFHPINRITTVVIDSAFLLAMGLPAYAVFVNGLVRHYYGAFIHADLPWTYGPLKFVFVSPAMHRWHHSIDPKAYNTNFATVFSVFDLTFGTFRVPGACATRLGVPERMGDGLIGQYLHPLMPSSYGYLRRRLARWRVRMLGRYAP